MSANYERTCGEASDPKNNKPTIDQLLDFDREKLKANIIFWSRAPKYYKAVLSKLKELTQANSPRVKLNTACPSKYVTCITD